MHTTESEEITQVLPEFVIELLFNVFYSAGKNRSVNHLGSGPQVWEMLSILKAGKCQAAVFTTLQRPVFHHHIPD